MLTAKLKRLGLRSLKYIFFLTAVMAWMILLAPKENLSLAEQAYLQEFVATADSETSSQSQVATEIPIASGIEYGIVLEDGLYVRTGPGTEYPAIRMLHINNEVQLVEEIPTGWWKILIDGIGGYVKSDFIAPRAITGLQ